MDRSRKAVFLLLAALVLTGIAAPRATQAAKLLFLGDLDGDENGDGAVEINVIADQVMITHLEGLPQVASVTALDDSAVTAGDLAGIDCVVISSTVFSGNILTSFGGDGSQLFSLPVPIVSMEPGLADDIRLNDFAGTQGQLPQSILDIEDPVMLAVPAGPLSIATTDVEVIHHASLDEFPGFPPDIPPVPPSLAPGARAGASIFSPIGIRVATAVAVFAGRELADGTPAPGHRVGGFVGRGAFVSLNAEGLALFDREFALACPVVGDMDGDSDVDFDDIDDFVLGLNDAELYESNFGVPASLRGDTDGDGDQDFDDIQGFVGLLSQSGHIAAQNVPEPTALLLAASAVAAAALKHARRRGREKPAG